MQAQDEGPVMMPNKENAIHPMIVDLPPDRLVPNTFSLSVYGDSDHEIGDLMESIKLHGILVPLVVAPNVESGIWDVISGHRRLACAQALELVEVPCEIRPIPLGNVRRSAILAFNRQRRKTFSQLMREADALEELWGSDAKTKRLANLRRSRPKPPELPTSPDRLNSDTRNSNHQKATDRINGCVRDENGGRTDEAIARYLQIGGKDIYRQARTIWRLASNNDVRAQTVIPHLDIGRKTIHAAYKDVQRRDRFRVDFRPTPYDVWSFRQDRAFGIPYPGSIPPGIVAHALHYFTAPASLVVDPMAGGGTTIDVCQSMGRRCLAYDLHPARRDIRAHDIRHGFPPEVLGCDLIFCDPPYHTMLARQYDQGGAATLSLAEWVHFLNDLARHSMQVLRPGGHFALLLASQTEKDLPAGLGYLDHAFFGYRAAIAAGFLPVRRISCPMDGAYLPQHVRRARREGRLLGQVRDLLVMRKKSRDGEGADIESFLLEPRPGCISENAVAHTANL
jgi:ParB family transcriptional regulator, chromosome partitioning protein